MSVEVRGIREDELSRCLKLWHAVFDRDPPGYFERYFRADAEFQPEYTRVAVVDGEIVSAVQVVKRTVACQGFALTLGGIANVATLPDVRGKGYASECLRQAIDVMEADAMDFSTLGTGIHGFYARLGWEPVVSKYLAGPILPDLSDMSDVSHEVAIRPYASGDAAAVQAIYAEFNRDRPITVRRTPQYWRDWIGLRDGNTPGGVLVAESRGVPVAYCCHQMHEAMLIISEVGSCDANRDTLPPLITACTIEAIREGAERVSLRVPSTPEVRCAAELVLENVGGGELHGFMVRFICIERLLRGILPALSDHWRGAGAPRGALTFVGPGGPAAIRAGKSGLHVDSPGSAGAHELGQADLYGLLTGAGLPEGRVADSDGRLADSLFPRTDGWYWSLDGF